MANPLDIYQAALDGVSRAVLRGDLDGYLAAVTTPYSITTNTNTFLLTTRDELEATFLSVHRALCDLGATDYVRLARSAAYHGRDRIVGHHFTHILRHGERVAHPHAAQQVLCLTGGAWRFAAAVYAIDNAALPLGFPQAGARPEHLPPVAAMDLSGPFAFGRC